MSAPAIEQLVLSRIRSLAKDDELFQKVMEGNDESVRQKINNLRQEEKTLETDLLSIDKKVRMITDTFAETITNDKGHVMALELNRLDTERKNIMQKKAEVTAEANDLENQTISKDAAKQSLVAFTENYRELSPYDKRCLLSQLIHSIIYEKNKVKIRYYIIDNMDILLNKEGALSCPASRAGFEATLIWRPNNHAKHTFVDVFEIETYRGKDWRIMLRIIGENDEKSLGFLHHGVASLTIPTYK